jgi:hypothetical protein
MVQEEQEMFQNLQIHALLEDRFGRAGRDWSLERAAALPVEKSGHHFYLGLPIGTIFITIGSKVAGEASLSIQFVKGIA